jgi:uncharacterized repeat protein (TIGR01451 family)
VLTGNDGNWTGSPTYARQWNGNGTPIAGATGSTYTLLAAQAGQTITFTVTATNGGGSLPATSAATSAVLPAAPVNTTAPAVTGSLAVGDVLTTTDGTWTGAVSYAHQWKNAGGNLAGATAQTYTLQAGDAGATIRCTVTATNTGGSTPHDSNAVGPITATQR